MNERFGRGGFELRMVRLQPWKIWALAIVGGAVALVVAAALAGLMLILVPVFLLAGVAAKLLLGRSLRRARPGASRPDLIEGRYEVVEVRQPKM